MKLVFKILLIFIVLPGFSQTQNKVDKKFTLSGTLKDESGEILIRANVYIDTLQFGTTTNAYGFYSLSLPRGEYLVKYSYVGYNQSEININLNQNLRNNIVLETNQLQLEGIQVVSQKSPSQLQSLRSGMFQITEQSLKLLPSIGGEPDLIKAIQLFPGIQAAREGLSNFNVRGGSFDQNLIILDEATVYNPSHLLGFFSIFNSDVLKTSKIYKGDIPVKYGGRLSSLLEVNLKDGNSNRFSVSGGIGTISSRITLETPLFKKKGSILISARRSYADLFLSLSQNEDVKNNKIYFFDTYIKANYQINDKNRIYLSGYLGRDVFKYKNEYYVTWGNVSGTFRWNHLFSPKLFSNLSAIVSSFDYRLGQTADISGVEWNSSLSEVRLKYDFTYYLNPRNTLSFGLSSSLMNFNPGYIIAASDSSIFNNFSIPSNRTLESSIYLGNEQKIGKWITVSYGIRASWFINIGPSTVYNFNSDFEKTDSTNYNNWNVYNSNFGIEPRISAKFLLSDKAAIKTSYSRTLQFLHLISNTTTGTPLDIWVPSSPNIKPQVGNQVTIGYLREILKGSTEFSVETYYKKMENQIDYKDHANIVLNPEFEGELRFGTVSAYGLELFLRKKTGSWQGLISYTLSKVTKEFPDINDGLPYPAGFDRRHDISTLISYDSGKRWKFSATWIFLTGAPATFPVGRFSFGNVIVPVYSDRNAYRMPAYHRLDISATLKGKVRKDKRYYGEWNFSIFNVYNRKNAWIIYFKSEDYNPLATSAYKLYLFPIVPSISYNFKF